MFTDFILGAILKFIRRKVEAKDISEISDVGWVENCLTAESTAASETSLVR